MLKITSKFRVWLIRRMQKEGWGVERMATEAGMSPTAVCKIRAGKHAVSFTTAIKVANAFDLILHEMLEEIHNTDLRETL